jgi:hypothetical protein
VALLVAGALSLHVFMLGSRHAAPAAEVGHRHHAGHGDDAGAMAAFCFSVLAGAMAVATVVRPGARVTATAGSRASGSTLRGHGRRVDRGARAGPSWSAPVASGVRLRV